MSKKLSLYELAERLGYKVWEKDDLKRIYVNEGYNTQKTSTTTFIWQDENDEFKVNCYIECPSQPWNWIRSQKEKVLERVEDIIRQALAETYYLAVRKDDGKLFDEGFIITREEFMLTPGTYLSKEDVIKDLESNNEDPAKYDIIAISREDAEKERNEAWHNGKRLAPTKED
jgi:hypothetical protein